MRVLGFDLCPRSFEGTSALLQGKLSLADLQISQAGTVFIVVHDRHLPWLGIILGSSHHRLHRFDVNRLDSTVPAMWRAEDRDLDGPSV